MEMCNFCRLSIVFYSVSIHAHENKRSLNNLIVGKIGSIVTSCKFLSIDKQSNAITVHFWLP